MITDADRSMPYERKSILSLQVNMVIALFLLLVLFFVPSQASAFVSPDYPAIYSHQIARVLFLVACFFILSALINNRLYKEKGWRTISASLLWLIVWNIDSSSAILGNFG